MYRRTLLTFLPLLTVWLALVPCQGQNSSTAYWMSKTDGYQLTKQVDGTMTFHDSGGPDGKTSTAVTGYTIFKAPAGQQLTLRFTAPVDFTDAATHLYIYEGDCRYADGAPGDPQGWKQPVPEGYVADIIAGHEGTFTFSSGTCSVLYYSPTYYERGQGWSAVFTTSAAPPMRLTRVTALQDYAKDVYPARRDVELMTVDLHTEGSLNPIAGAVLRFRLTGSAPLDALTDIRCRYSEGVRDPEGATLPVNVEGDVVTVDYTGVLTGGPNYFVLVADVDHLSPTGVTLDAELTGVTAQGQECLTAPIAPPQCFEIKNMLLMEPGSGHVYRIGDEPRAFYDDGGPDGNYTRDFSGTATFVGADAASRIHIDFTRLRLYTSAQAIAHEQADVIRVYDGYEANPDSLLLEINTNDVAPTGVSSRSRALTVEFISVHYSPAAGFEATVRQFAPYPMALAGVEGAVASDKALNAGAAVEPMLDFNLRTHGTDPVLRLEALELEGCGTAPCASAATLLYYGRDSRRLAPRILGKVEFTAEGKAVMHLSTPLTLLEGDNYFTVSLDINSRALRGQTTGCTLTSVRLNGASHITGKGATRPVENVCHTYLGWQTVTLHEQWELHNPIDYNNTYGASDVDHTVTFVPGSASGKVELVMDSFLLTWPAVSSRVGPQFKVYSGPAPSGDPLWSVTKETARTGPGRTLRSTAPNGELTVVFNPLGEAGGSPQAGFTGRVYVVDDAPVSIGSVGTFAVTGHVAEPGVDNQPLLGIDVTKEGTGTPVVHSLTVDLKNSAPNISAVKVFAVGNGLTFRADSLIGTAPVAMSDRLVTIPLEASLDHRTTRFFIAIDLKAEAAHGQYVEVELTALTASVPAPAVSGVPGRREIRPVSRYQGNGQSVRVPDSGVLVFYDNGGPDRHYTTEATGSVVLLPPAGKVLRLEIEEFHTSPNDDFYVYSGRNADKSNPDRAALLWGKVECPDTVWSDASDGSLAISFTPRRDNVFPGWVMRVCAVEPRPRSVKAVSVARVTKDTEWLYRDGAPVAMLEVCVDVQGNTGSADAPVVPLDMALTVPDHFKRVIWYTSGKKENFSNAVETDMSYTVTGVAVEGTSHTGTLCFNESGRHYLWVGAELAPDAPFGAYIEMMPARRQIGKHIVEGYPKVMGVTGTSATVTAMAYRPCAGKISLRDGDSRVLSLDTLREQTVVFTGLTPSTPYEVRLEAGGEAYTCGFITGTAQGSATPLEASITAPAYAQHDSSVTLTAQVKGGVPPYACAWTDAAGHTLPGSVTTQARSADGPTFKVEVTDATGSKVRAYTQILTDGPMRTATFDDVLLPSWTRWYGDTTAAYYDTPFLSGSFSFPTYWRKSWNSWARFAVVNSSASHCLLSTLHQFNSSAGCGAAGTASYAVAYVDPYFGACALSVANAGTDLTIPGLWLTNTAWVRDAIVYGDGMSLPEGGMTQGDWLKLTITGTRSDGAGTSKDIYLADYRSANPSDHYVLTSWEWFPLEDLGPVSTLQFTLEGTKRNQFGMTTPAYICLDEIGAPCPARQADTLMVYPADPTVRLDEYFPAADGCTSRYFLLGNEERCVLSDPTTGTVRLSVAGDTRFTLVAGCSRRGHNDYVAIPLHVTDDGGVAQTCADDPVLGIYTPAGVRLDTLDTDGLLPGVYIIRKKSSTTKIIIK